jgi:hypothetical protein
LVADERRGQGVAEQHRAVERHAPQVAVIAIGDRARLGEAAGRLARVDGGAAGVRRRGDEQRAADDAQDHGQAHHAPRFPASVLSPRVLIFL